MKDEEGPSPSGVTTGQQFEEALRVAEDLMRQADREAERADRLLTAEIGTAAVAIALAAIIAIVGSSSGFTSRVLVVIIGGFAGLIVAAALHFTVRARLIGQSRRDEQAAADVVSLLREVVMLIPGVEDWNVTQVRLARARLSRFPLGTTGFSEE